MTSSPRSIRRAAIVLLWLALLHIAVLAAAQPADPLPSWNEGVGEEGHHRVRRAGDDAGAEFVPVAQRIATFDNDRTLWSEQR